MTSWISKIHAPKKNLVMKGVCFVLYLISLLYAVATSIRNFFYDQKWFKVYRPKAFVISVGNLVAGGVGKTPLTLKIAEKILDQKFTLAILSRGYQSTFEHGKLSTLLSQGRGPLYPPNLSGDEPYLLSKNVPKALFYVGKDRVQSAQMAEYSKAQVLLLDDALQHRRLHRDFEIIMLDARDPFGKNHFLPRGFLRESLKALKRADLIVIHHADHEEEVQNLSKILKGFSKAPQVLTQVYSKGFYNLKNQKIQLPKEERVAAFCAIAKPTYFFETLKKEGVNLILHKSLKDHEKMLENEWNLFSEEAKKRGARFILCTEKDAVKMAVDQKMALPVAYLKIGVKVISGIKHFEKMFEILAQKVAN